MRTRALVCALFLAAACGGSAPTGTPTTPTSSVPGPTSPCETLSISGAYTLAADIGTQGNKSVCLTISANDVTVDCAGHTIKGSVHILDGGARVTVQNCVMSGIVQLTGVSNVTISNSTMSSPLSVVNGHNFTLDHNRIVLVGGNPADIVFLQNGEQNQIVGNTLDGFYTGHDLTGHGKDGPGADDGVVLDNEAGDVVRDNTIQNVFDAGIESVDTLSAATISNNMIAHAIFAGVASYWCTHWENNSISGNIVSGGEAAVAISFQSNGFHCDQVPLPSGRFAGNTVAGNSLRNPIIPNPVGISIMLDSLGGSVTSNTISGNDLGTAPIFLLPLAGFSNGGGNICGPGGSIAC
jgi:hypothetical protein